MKASAVCLHPSLYIVVGGVGHPPLLNLYCMFMNTPVCQWKPHNSTLSLSSQLFWLWINRLTALNCKVRARSLQHLIMGQSPVAVFTRSCCVFPALRQGCDLLNWSVFCPYLSHFSKAGAELGPKWSTRVSFHSDSGPLTRSTVSRPACSTLLISRPLKD